MKRAEMYLNAARRIAESEREFIGRNVGIQEDDPIKNVFSTYPDTEGIFIDDFADRWAEEGKEQRVLICCFAAAMAETDDL